MRRRALHDGILASIFGDIFAFSSHAKNLIQRVCVHHIHKYKRNPRGLRRVVYFQHGAKPSHIQTLARCNLLLSSIFLHSPAGGSSPRPANAVWVLVVIGAAGPKFLFV
jgi:hypothetical protein